MKIKDAYFTTSSPGYCEVYGMKEGWLHCSWRKLMEYPDALDVFTHVPEDIRGILWQLRKENPSSPVSGGKTLPPFLKLIAGNNTWG